MDPFAFAYPYQQCHDLLDEYGHFTQSGQEPEERQISLHFTVIDDGGDALPSSSSLQPVPTENPPSPDEQVGGQLLHSPIRAAARFAPLCVER